MTLVTSDDEPVDDDTLEEPEAKRQKRDTDIAQPAAPVEPEKETPVETTGTWGTGDGSDWGAAAAGSWGQDIAVVEEESAWASLQVDKFESFFSLLGPTVLLLTHSWDRLTLHETDCINHSSSFIGSQFAAFT